MQYISGEARKPSIFVSSTCYDLKQIRRDIREFIEADLGYEAILSEYDSFPIDPDKDTINNCLRVVEQRADILQQLQLWRTTSWQTPENPEFQKKNS